MSNMCERKNINEVMPNLRVNGGFFQYIGSYNFLNTLNVASLYSARSGNKKISSLIDYYISDENETLTDAQEHFVGELLKNVYEDKWNKIAGALRRDYDVLIDYKLNNSITKEGTSESSKTTQHDTYKQTNQYGQEQEIFQKGQETIQNVVGAQSDSTVYGAQEITVQNQINGFNGGSVNDNNSTTNNGSHTDTINHGTHTDTTTTSSQDDTTIRPTHTDVLITDGYDVTDVYSDEKNDSETHAATGQNTASQELLEKELELRKFDFVEMMFKDIDKYLTLKVYCTY